MPLSINTLSKQQIASTVVPDTSTMTYPAVSMAFTILGILPQASDWITATWAQTPQGVQYAYVLVGPNDGASPVVNITLAEGVYAVWTRVTDTTQVSVFQSDTLTITGPNYQVPIVTVDDMGRYMGYPFNPDQVVAVQEVIDMLISELENYLQAGLSVQQYTEYPVIVNAAMADTFLNSFYAVPMGGIFPDVGGMNLIDLAAPVILKHWPIVSWDYLGLAVPYQDVAFANSASVNPQGFTVIGTYSSNPVVAGNAASTAFMIVPEIPTYPQPLPLYTPGTQLLVQYHAGWQGADIAVAQGIIKRAAARELTNRLDDAVGLKSFSTVRLQDGPGPGNVTPGFTQQELMRVSRLKHRVVVN